MSDRGTVSARVCVLTAGGRGAIAVLRVWGRDALRVADSAFRAERGPRLAASRAGRPRVGRVGCGPGDQVVAIIICRDPAEVEIQCHGGTAAVRLVLDALEARGAATASATSWVNASSVSALSAQAWCDLAEAPTMRTAEILLEQAQGALDRDLRRLLETSDTDATAFGHALDALLARAVIGARLISGWRVVLAGRPNVGKSRLFNALAGFDRAIVDSTPGTTRDVVSLETAIDGWPVELSDTAGLRTTAEPIEAEGVAHALSRQLDADLVLLVLDASEPLVAADLELCARYPGALRTANKSDLPPVWDAARWHALPVSAQRGDGIEALTAAIARKLVPSALPHRAGVPFRARQIRLLSRAHGLCREGRLEKARLAIRLVLDRAIREKRADRGFA